MSKNSDTLLRYKVLNDTLDISNTLDFIYKNNNKAIISSTNNNKPPL